MQALIGAAFILHQRELHVVPLMNDRTRLHVSGYPKTLYLGLIAHFVQLGDGLEIGLGFVDPAHGEPSKGPDDHSAEKPELNVRIHLGGVSLRFSIPPRITVRRWPSGFVDMTEEAGKSSRFLW